MEKYFNTFRKGQEVIDKKEYYILDKTQTLIPRSLSLHVFVNNTCPPVESLNSIEELLESPGE
jgi:hypothetical protein